MDARRWQIGLVGYGEVGRIFAEDLRAQGLVVHAHDVKLAAPSTAQALQDHAAMHGVRLQRSHAALAAEVDLLVSAVTAGQTLAVARACAAAIKPGAFLLDVNSASPGAKREAAAFVNVAGGRYVEGAAMTSVPPYRIKVPLLLGGPDAEALAPLINGIGFSARVFSRELGIASATKLCRSVMIKGMEAMVIESLTAARFHGVEDAVIASLRETFPGIDWERQATHFFQRVIAHGRRRSEEMHEASETVREAGLAAWSADGTAERQAWMADLADAGVFGSRDGEQFADSGDWRVEADRVLARRDTGILE